MKRKNLASRHANRPHIPSNKVISKLTEPWRDVIGINNRKVLSDARETYRPMEIGAPVFVVVP